MYRRANGLGVRASKCEKASCPFCQLLRVHGCGHRVKMYQQCRKFSPHVQKVVSQRITHLTDHRTVWPETFMNDFSTSPLRFAHQLTRPARITLTVMSWVKQPPTMISKGKSLETSAAMWILCNCDILFQAQVMVATVAFVISIVSVKPCLNTGSSLSSTLAPYL